MYNLSNSTYGLTEVNLSDSRERPEPTNMKIDATAINSVVFDNYDNTNPIAHRAADPGEYDSDFNGNFLGLDLRKPVDYVSDEGRVVLTAAQHLDVRETLVWRLWVIQGKPPAALALSEQHLVEFTEIAAEFKARHQFMELMYHADAQVMFRASDTVPATEVPNVARKAQAVDRIMHEFEHNDAWKVEVADQGRYVLMSVVANAIHRHQFEGHNWFTGNMNDPRSDQSKILRLAGRDKDGFKAWMSKFNRAHDANHAINDASLQEWAAAVAGKSEKAFPLVGAGGAAGFDYAGERLGGKKLNYFLELGPSVSDRYPPNELGKAAVIVGFEMVAAMMSDIMTHVKVVGAEPVVANATKFGAIFRRDDFKASDVRAMEPLIADALAVVAGYCMEADLMRTGQYPALENHANRKGAAKSSGASLARAIDKTNTHSEAIEGAVLNTIASISAAMDHLSGLEFNGNVGPGGALPRFPAAVPIDVRKVSIQAGTSDQDKLLETLQSMNFK